MRRLLLAFLIALSASACGKKGPLIYPDLLVPEAPKEVTLWQSGLGMKFSFFLPQKDRAGRPLTDLAGVKVMKRETIPAQEEVCPACTSAFRLFRTLYVDFRDEGAARRYGNLMVVLDSDVTLARNYTYTIVPFTKDGVDGQGSAPVTATMVEPPPEPSLRVIPTVTDIRLEFGGRTPAAGTFMGYNIYRAVKGEPLPFLPLNKEPVRGKSYTDSGLDRYLTYRYAARTVVRLPTGEKVESGLSNQEDGALRNEE
ncbi:MAG TPA: hypothetical protein VF795_13110 [Desulfuromonadaceae bacterium]